MRLWMILAATLAIAACTGPDEQTVEARARNLRTVTAPPALAYPAAPSCLGSTALTYSCQNY